MKARRSWIAVIAFFFLDVIPLCLIFAVIGGRTTAAGFRSFAEAASSEIEKAKSEGEVVWYTTTSNNDNLAIVKAFNEKYPFIRVQILRTTGEKLRTRILAEGTAGKYFADTVGLNAMEMSLLKSKNLLLPYPSPEAASYPPGAKDTDGAFTGMYARNFVIGYNTLTVSKDNIPQDWPDLLDPRWKGKIGLDEEEFEWFGTLVDYWGREKTIRFMKALANQQPQLRRGHTLLAQLLAAGEFSVAVVFPYQVEQLKLKGAPIDWATRSDPIVTSLSTIGVSARAPHPNAAKVLLNFVLSVEGQTVFRDLFRVPVRPGITPLAPKLDQSRLKIHYVPGDMFKKIAQYEKEFREIFWKKR